MCIRDSAKAGNLNHALFHAAPATRGQYVLVLDCDMVPQADILQALLPHCLDVHRAWDPSVALVQSPQAFSNLEPGDPLNNASPVRACVDKTQQTTTHTHLLASPH